MVTQKTTRIIFLLLLCTQFFALRLSYGALPNYYMEKRIFYDSLSTVLNKYISPVGNWVLFKGTLQGLQDILGEEHFHFKPADDQIELRVMDIPPFVFKKDVIDNNAIELVESFSKIFDTAFDQFADTDKTSIIHAAIRGMVASLEPNSYFIDPEDLQMLQAQNKGFFEGIGLEITSREGVVTVVSPYDGSPAFRQGLQPNDRILAVDGASTKGMHIMDVSKRIRGEIGEPVTLTIERLGCDTPRDIVMVRETILHRTVKALELEPGFGYIRIMNFLGTTVDDFSAALTSLDEVTPLKGLILDLRYNPGGLLNQALGIADFFLNTGVITSTDGRIKSDNKTYYARPGTLPSDYPIVILVNKGSASSSEVVAATLRSHERAVLVGETTFGKGYIQTIFPLPLGGAIRLTTSMLLTPEGEIIQDVGIKPDLLYNTVPPASENQESPGWKVLPTLAEGAARDDPSVQLSLDILKRALLLQQVSESEIEGLSQEQVAIKKRFRGLNVALEEIAGQKHLQIIKRKNSPAGENALKPTFQ